MLSNPIKTETRYSHEEEFLLKYGQGFAFVGRQYLVLVGEIVQTMAEAHNLIGQAA